ncbi:MAG: NAD/FAD-dependent oxidoreductase, partial [Halobacteriales archaeon]|nr:NAD/FAD-dependent oxidoreductase [Halobacteriales archaeon]
YGANYVKDDDPRVAQLLTETLDTAGLVDIPEPVWTFDGEGTVAEGRPTDGHKWTYRTGISEVAMRLLDPAEVRLELGMTVDRVAAAGSGWSVATAGGTEWGPFDSLVLTPPAPVTSQLLETAAWDGNEKSRIVDAIQAVPYRSVWTAVLGYPFPIDEPYYALVNPSKDHAIGWISREECKPGHVPDGQTVLIVQANHEWSIDNADADSEQNVTALARLAADIMDDERLATPNWTDAQNWRRALAEDRFEPDARAQADAAGLFCVGDWVAGEARVHAAIRSGLAVRDRLRTEG